LTCHQRSDTKHKYRSVCGEPATDIICWSCQAKIQGEVAHRKQQTEKEAKQTPAVNNLPDHGKEMSAVNKERGLANRYEGGYF
jgi:hypothetical protein